MRTLVVFYSRSGHTRQIALEIAARCGADLEEIREARPRDGLWGYWRSAMQVLRGSVAPIQTPAKDPEQYDCVIIGTPVWVQQAAPPVQTYLRERAANLQQVAFFCTLGGSGEKQAFDTMARLSGKTPLATLAVTEKQVPASLHAAQLDAFLARVAH